MPWVTVIAGCLAGTVILAAYAYIGHSYHMPLSATTVRLTFLPAIATLAFVLQTPFRPLAQAAPVPAWLAPAIQVVLAIPVLALTCWVQLGLRAYTYGGHGPGLTAGAYPLIAQLAGWSAIFVAATACCDRSRYADISGMIAVPVSLVIIALASFAPGASNLLSTPPASPHTTITAWYVVAALALALTCAAMRDRWHRYRFIRIRLARGPRDPERTELARSS